MKTRRWSDLLALWPGSIASLQSAMGCDRQSLWWLRAGIHRRMPHRLLERLASAFASAGTATGSPVPTQQELAAAWGKAFGKRQNEQPQGTP